jgi:hypothetical protein
MERQLGLKTSGPHTISVKTMAALVTISPVSGEDLTVLSDYLLKAKLSLTINRLLIKNWPNEKGQKPIYAGAIEGGFTDPNCECLKAVDSKSGEIVGFVVSSLKQPRATANAAELNVPSIMEPSVYAAVMSAAADLDSDMADVEHLGESIAYNVGALAPKTNSIGICRDHIRLRQIVSQAPWHRRATDQNVSSSRQKAGPCTVGLC